MLEGDKKRLLVLSDLHLGPVPGGPYDFHAGGVSLGDAVRAAEADVVVLNGDVFDLLEDDQPLSLEPRRVSDRLRAILATDAAQALLAGLRAVLDAGGEVVVRPGNHDLELHLDEAVAVLRAALPGVAVDPAPVTTLTVRGRRVAIDHGRVWDDWNRYSAEDVRRRGPEEYPPGSLLVKGALNPARRDRNLRFLGVLAPDWLAAAVAAIAVDPTVARVIDAGAAARIAAALGLRGIGLAAIPVGDGSHGPEDAPLPDDAHPPLEVADWLRSTLAPTAEATFAALAPDARPRRRAALRWALVRWNRRRLRRAARAADPELDDARSLGDLYGAGIVLRGHTHGPRAAVSHDGVIVANSGSWTLTMDCPAPDAPEAEWDALLDDLAADRDLDGRARPRVRAQRTGVIVDDQVRTVEFAGAWQTWQPRAPSAPDRAPALHHAVPAAPEPKPETVARHVSPRVEALLAEIEAYERRPDPLLPEGHRQLFAEACRSYVRDAASDTGRDAATALVQAQAVWHVVRDLDGQRRGRMGEALAHADAVVWHGYEHARKGLTPSTEARLPFPLCVLDPDYGPATTPRDQLLRADRGGQAMLQAVVPLVYVPPDHLACPRWLTLLLHEVGHDIDVDHGLTEALRDAVRAAAPTGHQEVWAGWTREMIADLIGWRLGGSAFLRALREVGEAVQPLRLLEPPTGGYHPPLALRFAVLGALGAAGPEVAAARASVGAHEAWWEAAAPVARALTSGVVGAQLLAIQPLPWADEVLGNEANAWTHLPPPAPWQPSPQEREFLITRLPTLAPTEVGPGGFKKPPAALMRDHDELVFVGEVHDQLLRGLREARELREATARRGQPFARIEVFLLSEAALRWVAEDDAEAGRLIEARARSIDALRAALPDLAGSWALREYRRSLQYLAVFRTGATVRVHTSARLWGLGVKNTPGLDWRTLDVTHEDGDAPIRKILKAVDALRVEATLIAEGGSGAGAPLSPDARPPN